MPPRGGKAGKAQYYKNLEKKSRDNEQSIRGPGIFVTCPRRKEHKAVFEAYDLFNQTADRLYPSVPTASLDDEDSDEEEDDIEAMIAKEVSEVKKTRAQGGQRFQSRKTYTDCVVFISVAEPLDPIVIVEEAVKNLIATQRPTTQHVSRLTPISATCSAAAIEPVLALAETMLAPHFGLRAEEPNPRPLSFKIEVTIRSHNTLTRDQMIQSLGQLVIKLATTPPLDNPSIPHRATKADLTHPNKVVLISIFKSTCGMSVVDGVLYEKSKRFNLDTLGMEVLSPIQQATPMEM